MKVAIVIGEITLPDEFNAMKKMALVEVRSNENDEYTILSKFTHNLKKELGIKDIRKAKLVIRANVVGITDVNPEASSDDICTDILLNEYFAHHLGNKYIV